MTHKKQECLTTELLIETECSSNLDQQHENEARNTGNIIISNNNSNVPIETNHTNSKVLVSESVELTELERYLSGILTGLQKQQESQKNEVLQLILQQHQSLQHGEGFNQNIPTSLNFNTMQSSSSYSAWTFTQGLVLGQLSVIIFVIAFIKFFIFTEAAPTQASSITSSKKSSKSIIKTNKSNEDIDISRLQTVPLGRISTDHNGSTNELIGSASSLNDIHSQNEVNKALGLNSLTPDFDSTLKSILEKTYYDVKTHKPESLDWFNVLIAQIISQARLEALNDGNIHESLNKALNSPQVLQYFDSIKITEINVGDDYPIFSNCRVKNNDGRLEANIDVDVSDTITLAVDTNLLINQPKFLSASLPIKLSISVVRFSACLTVSLIATDDNDEADNENGNQNSNMGKNKPDSTSKSSNNKDNDNHDENKNKSGHSIALMFSFSPDFRLEFEIKSLIGSRAKLENIPRISSILENVIRKWFIERCIEPRFQLIKLPSMWPRKKNTRHSVSTEG